MRFGLTRAAVGVLCTLASVARPVSAQVIGLSLDAASSPVEYDVCAGSNGYEPIDKFMNGSLPASHMNLFFSVDRLAFGIPGSPPSAVHVEAQAVSAHGDIFALDMSSISPTAAVYRQESALGLDPGFYGDDIDGLQISDNPQQQILLNSAFDYQSLCRSSLSIGQPANFSGGGAADPDGLTPDDIALGILNVLFASGVRDMGLQPGDAIDGLILMDVTPDPSNPEGFRREANGVVDPGFDMAIFSLDPFSPSTSLFGPWKPGDLIKTRFMGDQQLFLGAAALGLSDTDNLDAAAIISERVIPEPGMAALFLLMLGYFVRSRGR